MLRSTLGTVLGALLQAYVDITEDPINDLAGFTPDPSPALNRIAAECGWSVQDIRDALKERGVSPRWQYMSSIEHVLDECMAELPASPRRSRFTC